MKPFLIFLLTATISCSVQRNPGLSYKSAIVINHTDPAKGATDELNYLKENYSGYQVVGRQTKQEGRRHYDIIYVRGYQMQWVIYFDITSFYDNILPNK